MFRFWTFDPEVWHSPAHESAWSLEWSLAETALTPGEYIIYEG